MSDNFVPLSSATTASALNGFAPLQLRSTSSVAVKPAPTNPPGESPKSEHGCATPKVTLQKTGDVVSGIRIQCSCGQVIELACAY